MALTLPIDRWRRRWQAAALDLAFPPRCAACKCDLAEEPCGVGLCRRCQAGLQGDDGPACPRCAASIPATDGIELSCSHCRGDKLLFDRAFAWGSYEGPLRQLIMQMKADRRNLLARCLVDLAWRQLEAKLAEFEFDVVAAVPMHWRRRWSRGTNPPQTMAERLAEKLRLPATGRMLRLVRDMPPQVGLSRRSRFRNMAGEMVVRTSYHLAAARVLLVDDVLTTGATCSEAARALRSAGASEVSVFVLARTPAED